MENNTVIIVENIPAIIETTEIIEELKTEPEELQTEPISINKSNEINEEQVELRRCDIILPAVVSTTNINEQLSTSVPTQKSLWPTEYAALQISKKHTIPSSSTTIQRGSLNFSEMFSNGYRCEHNEYNNIRHSMSTTITAMRQQQKENETIAMIRGASSCSKDTVLFMDQQNSYIDDDNSYLGNRSLWVS